METIIKNIVEKLESIPDLNYVGDDWGQIKVDQPQVNFPCALVDFGEITFTQQPNKTQLANASIRVSIADESTSGTSPYKIYEILKEVHILLHGYETELHSKFVKNSVKRVQRNDTIKEFVIEFTTNFIDASAAKVYTPHPTPPGITVTL